VAQIRNLAARQKRRFLTLYRQFPTDIDASYSCAILQGLFDNDHHSPNSPPLDELSIDEITGLIPSEPRTLDVALTMTVCRRLRRPNEPFPIPWLNILLEIALHHPDPATPSANQSIRTANGRTSTPGHDIVTNGLNHARGAAIFALAKALFDDKEIALGLRAEIPCLLQDPSLGVRAMMIELLIAWLNIDANEAAIWFTQLVEGNDSLLHCSLAEPFLGYACHRSLDQLESLIDHMTENMSGEARLFGIRQTIRAAFISPRWKERAERLLIHRDSEVRKHVVSTVADHWPVPMHREQSERWLRLGFYDRNPSVSESAAKVFDRVPNAHWNECADLVRSFAGSRALLHTPESLFLRIGDAKPLPVDLIIDVVEHAMIERKRCPKASKKLDSYRWGSHGIPKLVLRAYHNTTKPQQKIRCLDLLDDMLMDGFSGIRDLDQSSE
jgi:hypothetical protein